jgi:hypothetical protein
MVILCSITYLKMVISPYSQEINYQSYSTNQPYITVNCKDQLKNVQNRRRFFPYLIFRLNLAKLSFYSLSRQYGLTRSIMRAMVNLYCLDSTSVRRISLTVSVRGNRSKLTTTFAPGPNEVYTIQSLCNMDETRGCESGRFSLHG